MAVTHYDLTATFTDLLGTAYSPTSAKVVAWIETNVASSEGIVDEVANSIALGGSRQTADSSGNVTWTGLVGSDSDAADINLESGTLQYRVTAEYVDAITRRRKTWVSGWFSLTADIDLADVVAETYVPAAWMTTATATLQAYVDAGQAAATTASAAATTASGAADTAVNAAGLASEIALGDADAAFGAAQLNPASPLSVAQGDVLDDPTHPLTAGLSTTFVPVFNVKKYGATGDGTTDDTTAIQAAVTAAASGGVVYFPVGIYKLTAAINISANGITIRGANREKSHLQQATAGAKIINNTAQDTNISDLRFSYVGTPTAGGVAIYSSGANAHFNNIRIVNGYTGIEFLTGTGSTLSNAHIYDCVSIGIYVHDVNDIFISKFLLVTTNPAWFALGAIRVANRAEAIIFTDGDTIGGAYPLATTATTYGIGTRPAYNNFTNVFFDSAVNGALIDKMVETDFVGCWFSNGRSGAGQDGALVTNADSITFTSCRFFNCGGHGCRVVSTALRTVFVACKFESNSYTAGAGVSHGLVFGANTTDFTVTNCIAHNGLMSGTQGWGIIVNGGTSNRYVITNNLVSGNVTGGVLDSGSGVNKTVSGNW